MLEEDNAAVLKDWADESRRLESALRVNNEGRDGAIRHALKLGAGVGELVKVTGLTRARIYQIKKVTR